MNTALAPRKPFLPSDLPAERILPRAILAHAVAATTPGKYADVVARAYWPRDPRTLALVQRATTIPATTTLTGWAADLAHTAVGAFLGSLQDSAAASLFAAAARYDLSGLGQLTLPRASSTGGAAWVGEGSAIQVPQGVITGSTLGPARKLAIVESCTREIAEATPEGGESIVTTLVTDAVTRQLDTSLFSSTAGSALQPAGVVAGITPTVATTGGGPNAALGDLRNLTDAIVTAGASGNPLFFTSPGRALTLRGYFGGPLAAQVFGSSAISSSTLIAVDPRAFASAFGADPEIQVSREATIHFEDAAPQPISTPGAPNVVAAPVRSAFQTDVLLIKCILRAAWCLRIPGAASWINAGLTW